MYPNRKRILFLTTANLPTNPRLVKELDLLRHKNKEITVVQFNLGNWSDRASKKMKDQRPDIKFIELSVSRSHFLTWALWAFVEKAARIVRNLFPDNLFITALSQTRRAIMIYKKIKRLNPELIIAHNIGALYPAWKLAKTKNIPFIYDIEDYDPGIHVPQIGKRYKDYSEQLLKSCLHDAVAITSASPLIGKYTLNLIGGHPNHEVILNSFPESEFRTTQTLKFNSNSSSSSQEFFDSKIKSSDLKVVWFSQNISFGRGLEQFLKALSLLDHQEFETTPNFNIHITLIGNMDAKFNSEIILPFLKIKNSKHHITQLILKQFSIYFKHLQPLPQIQLHSILLNYDIGLAIEPGKDLNNKLALSNKIFAYAQAGLYILATDTPAQKQFLLEDPGRGILCGQTPEEMAQALRNIIKQKEKIKQIRVKRYEKAKNMAWENESKKLGKIWNDVFDD